MRCGWCEQTATWSHAVLGYSKLTGYHLLGVHKETRQLVVLAEARTLSGQITYLPHHCEHIPADQHARYAPAGTVLVRPAPDAS